MDKRSAFGEQQSRSLLFSAHLSRGGQVCVPLQVCVRICARSHTACAEVVLPFPPPPRPRYHCGAELLGGMLSCQLRGTRVEGSACGARGLGVVPALATLVG